MKKLLWIFFIGICFAQSGQNFLKKTEVGDSINAHLTNYADKPEMMDSILANAGTVSGLPDTALTLRQVIIDSSSAIRADMGNASVNYIDSVANLKLDKSALKDSINSRNLVYEPELDDSVSNKLRRSELKDSVMSYEALRDSLDLHYIKTDQTIPQTIGLTGARLLKLWATDITVTNAITGSITGNAATVTTNANLTGVVTSTGNATSFAASPSFTGTLTSAGDIVLSNSGTTRYIYGNTADAADNGRIMVTPANVAGMGRGAYFWLAGNEHSSPGTPGGVLLATGDVTGSKFTIAYRGTDRILIDDASNTDITGAIIVSTDISNSGDTYWTGDGSGIPYGSCYGNEIAWSQASAAQDTYYNISDADMTDGSGGLNLVTHDGSGKITVTKAGRYMITYSIAGSCNAVDKHIKSGIEINGSGTIVGDGQDHNISNAVDANIPLGSCAILDLAANATIEISIGTTDTGTPTISVDHLNIVVTMVGGT